MPRLLIVNADDFGLSRDVNAGILEAHAHGVVTSTSLMVLRQGAEDAARLARGHPSLSVGLHLDGDDLDLDDADQATRTFAAQLERFRELVGADPTHVDSHHHVHASGSRLMIFSQLVAPLGVPLRHDGRVRYLGRFWGQEDDGRTALDQVGVDSLLQMIRSQTSPGFTEIGCHPARVTGDFQSSYLEEREAELQTLTQPGLRGEIEAAGVELVSYRDWRSRSG